MRVRSVAMAMVTTRYPSQQQLAKVYLQMQYSWYRETEWYH